MNTSSKILCSALLMLGIEEYGFSVSFGYKAPEPATRTSNAHQNNKASSGAKNNSGYFNFLKSNSKVKNEAVLKEQNVQKSSSASTEWSLFKPKSSKQLSLSEQLNNIEIPTEKDFETTSQADTASINSDASSIVSDLSYQNEIATTPLQQAQSRKHQDIQDYKEWQSAQKQHQQESLAPQGNKLSPKEQAQNQHEQQPLTPQGNKLSPKEQAQQMTRQAKNAAEQKTAARQRIQDQKKHENKMQVVQRNVDVNQIMIPQFNSTRSQRVNTTSSSAQPASTSGWKSWFKPAA